MPASSPLLLTAGSLAPVPKRFLSIDVLRGGTIALMILVNEPGDGNHIFEQLGHADWHGATLADLVFPNFLFLVGASTVFSIESRRLRGDSRVVLARHMVKRAAKLFALKMALTALSSMRLGSLRVYGVLTRTALCFLCAGLLSLVFASLPALLAVIVVLLLGYWGLLRLVPVPGRGIPGRDLPLLDRHDNLAAWLDRIFTYRLERLIGTGGELYEGDSDPEGLLSTLPAVATTLMGAAAATWLHTSRGGVEKRNGLATMGVAAFVAGKVWDGAFPINKNLWTSSYALYAGGVSLSALSVLFYAIDCLRLQHRSHVARVLVWPWVVFGSNAIVAYAVSELLGRALRTRLPAGPQVRERVYEGVFARKESSRARSLAFAVTFVALCFLPNLVLWRRRVFVKI